MSGTIGTMLVLMILLLIVALIIRGMIRDKKAGKSSCGCNCAKCAMAGKCHSVSTTKKM